MHVSIWDLFEGTSLFRAVKDGCLNDELHLAEMVSLLGPPPKAFLERSAKCNQYWNADGESLHPIASALWPIFISLNVSQAIGLVRRRSPSKAYRQERRDSGGEIKSFSSRLLESYSGGCPRRGRPLKSFLSKTTDS